MKHQEILARFLSTRRLFRSARLDSWVATRYEDVRGVLTEPRFSVDRKRANNHLFRSTSMRPLVQLVTSPGVLLGTDDGNPRNYRQTVDAFVRQFDMTKLDLQAAHLARRVRLQREFDIVDDYARPLVQSFIEEFTGLEIDAAVLRDCSELVLQVTNQPARVPVDLLERALASLLELTRSAFSARRCQGGLVGHLKREYGNLPNDHLVRLVALVLIAGYETTTSLISAALTRLATSADSTHEVLPEFADRSIVAEFLRLDGPIVMVPRIATATMTFADASIREGEVILAVLAAANRDEDQFTQPNHFLPLSHARAHLSFGTGRHRCPGASLAEYLLLSSLQHAGSLLTKGRVVSETWDRNIVIRRPNLVRVRLDDYV